MITKTYRIVTETNNDGAQVKRLFAPHLDNKEAFVVINNEFPQVHPDVANFRLVGDDYLAKRVDSLDEALALANCESVYFWSYQEYKWADEICPLDDDDNDCDTTDFSFYSAIVTEFNLRGYIYVSFLMQLNDRVDDDQRFKITSVDADKDYFVVPTNGKAFVAKYKAGTNMFYHTNTDKKQLNVGKINEIVIRQKAGYQPSVTYNMTNGASVGEALIATPEMAHEWVKSNS